MPRTVNSVSLGVWRERLTAPENAGLTSKELGEMFDVHASTVLYWRRKLADGQRPEVLATKSSPNFLPVFVNPVSSTQNVVVRLPGDVTISVPCDATSALVTVLGQLQSQAS